MEKLGSGDHRFREGTNEVMTRALASARMEERYCFNDHIEFTSVRDHILPSVCKHVEGHECQVCLFNEKLELPHLPEMIFPNNRLTLKLVGQKENLIEFNTLDALSKVDSKNNPDVQVGPSAVWREARKDQLDTTPAGKPFDWTYTSDYAGTVPDGVKVEDTSLHINIEALKKRDPILFYSQLTLYEDELADHGCAHMSVRVRIMPSSFFVLCRFYLRVDHVMVRICDTRLFGDSNHDYILREWTCREAQFSDLSPQDLENVTDSNLIWQSLPVTVSKSSKISLE